jgi:hypothetical protein
LIVRLEANQELSLDEIRAFLDASEEIGFEGRNRQEVYGWVNQVLDQQGYGKLDRSGRGAGAKVCTEDDGVKSCPGDALDWPVSAW